MGEGRPSLYTIPAHRAFADALAQGLIERCGGDAMALARGLVLVPSNRAKRTISEAFVRASGGGLLLPRLVAIGDVDLEEAAGAALDPMDERDPVPPAINPLERRLILARLVQEQNPATDAAEAVRLAGELGRTLDQLLVEEVRPEALKELTVAEELQGHWAKALVQFELVLSRWPEELAKRGRIDLAERRSRLLKRTAARWRSHPPAGFVCAAGITAPAPAIAALLRTVADLPKGMVVLPWLDVDMPDEQWTALGPHKPDPDTGFTKPPLETHPQFQLVLLLDRMGLGRGECEEWAQDAASVRGRAIAHALAPAEFTAGWSTLPVAERRLDNVTAVEVATPAEEAQVIALALRGALETEGRTAALITPDRGLARRVAAHCARWGIAVDDSAGRPLSATPPGALLLLMAEAAAQDFAPVPLLALVKHPLARLGEARLAWLEGARALDRALRGPRPAPGFEGIDRHLVEPRWRVAAVWWPEAREALAPLAGLTAQSLAEHARTLREAVASLCGDAAWAGPAGREAAGLLSELEAGSEGPRIVEPESLAPLLETLMAERAVRPPQGGHPRLAIYGLIEARLQTADVMILGGLNEGVWPAEAAPDPWLAPRVRRELGLPSLQRRIGLSAHDFAAGLGAPEVLLTRSRRDARGPAVASRFWLRLEAISGGVMRDAALSAWARELDDPGLFEPSSRPSPAPKQRPDKISVTEVDRLKADPYAFYAKRVLGLQSLDPVDADPSAAWRGSAVHAVLEAWFEQDECKPEALRPRAEAMLRDERTHPMMRALWQPRLMEAIDWIAEKIAEDPARVVIAVEKLGKAEVSGVTLYGKFDRLDRLENGCLAVVDYKTGKPPSAKAVKAGYSLQLGLLGLIAERQGFEGIAGDCEKFEYWSLARKDGKFGFVESPVDPMGARGKIVTAEFVQIAAANFADVAGAYLTGSEGFLAKAHPEYAPYDEYDQLMRLDEWYGRD